MMESIKNREQRKSSRFIACFKPIDFEEEETNDRIIGSVKKIANRTNSWNRDSTVFVCNVVDSGDDEDGDSKDSMKMTKIKFSRIVKAVLFQSSLAKNMQKKKSRENLFRSNSNLSTNSERSISPAISSWSSSSHEELNKAIATKPTTTSSVSKPKLGRSRSLSICLSTPNNKLLRKKNKMFRANSMDRIKIKKRRDGDDWNCVLCLLLVSLFVMVLLGKACAILCTSAWIFIVQHRGVGRSSPERGVVVQEMNSVEYKKRIIMEGLLERNRCRVVL